MSSGQFRCSVPPAETSVRVLRSVVRAAAADLDASYDILDEIGLAVDEASGALLAVPGEGPLACEGRASGASLQVTMSREVADSAEWPPAGWENSLGAIVLHSVAHDVDFRSEAGRPVVQFRVGEPS